MRIAFLIQLGDTVISLIQWASICSHLADKISALDIAYSAPEIYRAITCSVIIILRSMRAAGFDARQTRIEYPEDSASIIGQFRIPRNAFAAGNKIVVSCIFTWMSAVNVIRQNLPVPDITGCMAAIIPYPENRIQFRARASACVIPYITAQCLPCLGRQSVMHSNLDVVNHRYFNLA